jgi:alkanesulfonate monooxygenase SsuD/methylene tetrahydromethanopterin reductase-like flavin-dependent oxidoreductase (luciferase family)
MRRLAADAGRMLRFGIRLHEISRDTSSDAWEVTERMLAAMSDEVTSPSSSSSPVNRWVSSGCPRCTVVAATTWR